MTRLLLGLLLVCLAGLALGDAVLPPAALWHGLTGFGADMSGDFVIRVLRGPRVVCGALAGAALGLSGAILQSLLRNPLAAPDVLGFTSGAGLGAMLVVTLGGAGAVSVTLGAAGGGILAAVAVAGLAWQRGLLPLRLILVGIGVAFTLQAGTDMLMTRLPSTQAADAARWLSGSLNARTWGHAAQLLICLAALVPLLALAARGLQLLEMGDDLAAGLGLNVTRARLALAALAVLLAATAVAVTGPVPFVALLAAPLAQRVMRRRGVVLAGAAVMGGSVTVLADLAARAAVPGVQLPLGVMTGILGAPYLLWRLTREMERGRL